MSVECRISHTITARFQTRDRKSQPNRYFKFEERRKALYISGDTLYMIGFVYLLVVSRIIQTSRKRLSLRITYFLSFTEIWLRSSEALCETIKGGL